MPSLLDFIKNVIVKLLAAKPKPKPSGPALAATENHPQPAPTPVIPRGKIVIDPGHGGRGGRPDPGAVGTRGGQPVYERDVVLAISIELALLLEQQGFKVVMTRIDNTTLSTLKDKVDICNSEKPDAFVSIHANANAGVPAQGIETLFNKHKKQSQVLAQKIQDSMIRAFPRHRNRGLKERSGLYVLRSTKVEACCLVECEFINHPVQVNFLVEKPKEIAQAIANGILDYFQ